MDLLNECGQMLAVSAKKSRSCGIVAEVNHESTQKKISVYFAQSHCAHTTGDWLLRVPIMNQSV